LGWEKIVVMEIWKAEKIIKEKLEAGLAKNLTYHTIAHTFDVLEAATDIAKKEGLSDQDLLLIQTAALFHDAGYLEKATGHEEISCEIAKGILPVCKYNEAQIEQVCEIIMATKLPQQPKSKLGEILADADLDYLGRDDYNTLANDLRKEFASLGKNYTNDEWNKIQIGFLEDHHYFTTTSQQLRNQQKQLHLLQLKSVSAAKQPQHTMKLSQPFIDIVYVVAGILFCGFALKGFLVPNHFFDGGVTGISLLIHELYEFNIAFVIILANIPFIIMGAFQANKSFAWKTFAAVCGLALCLQFMPYPQVTSDKLLVSIFGGVFMGIGVGLAIRGGCALDGIEVLAMYTGKRISFTISEIILGLNIIIFLIAAIELGLPTALYSIMTYYTASRTISFVIEGLEEYTGVTIISGENQLIKEKLVLELGRGITIYKGERGFLKDSFEISQPVDIIFTVVTRFEVRKLKNMVQNIDPKAFVFTNTIKEAAGGVLKKRVRH
jgi:uncharacterized membrane-anchored protein YitT (DUF2179 family)/predicted metal-dependent HD superfamily phosphohydrolase